MKRGKRDSKVANGTFSVVVYCSLIAVFCYSNNAVSVNLASQNTSNNQEQSIDLNVCWESIKEMFVLDTWKNNPIPKNIEAVSFACGKKNSNQCSNENCSQNPSEGEVI